jgi:hypothetical protein
MDYSLPLLIIIAIIVIIWLVRTSGNKILIFVISVILIVLLLIYFSKNSKNLTNIVSTKNEQKISADSLPSGEIQSNNYSMSIWFYVDKWTNSGSNTKNLITVCNGRMGCNPNIHFGNNLNNIIINIKTQNGQSPCTIENFPLQAWVNLIIVVRQQSMDVYLDGKLIKSCILTGIPVELSPKNIIITKKSHNGDIWSGWTSNFRYWDHVLNPQQAYNVYKDGYGSNGLGNFFNRYKIKFSYLVDNIEEGSVEI